MTSVHRGTRSASRSLPPYVAHPWGVVGGILEAEGCPFGPEGQTVVCVSNCVCELVWNVPVAGKADLCMTFELREIPLASFCGAGSWHAALPTRAG